MTIMNEVKDGADLTHPKMSAGWLVGAAVSIAILLVAVGIGSYMYRKGKTLVGGSVATVTAGAQAGMSGIFGDGT